MYCRVRFQFLHFRDARVALFDPLFGGGGIGS